MNEQTETTIFGILKLIPFAVVTAVIVLFWVDDFLGFVISLIFSWIPPLAIGLSIVFFIMGLRWRDIWQRIAVIWGGINVLLVVIYVLAVAPERRCNPDIMASIMRSTIPKWKSCTAIFKVLLPTVVLSPWNSRGTGWRCSMCAQEKSTTIQTFGMRRRVKRRTR